MVRLYPVMTWYVIGWGTRLGSSVVETSHTRHVPEDLVSSFPSFYLPDKLSWYFDNTQTFSFQFSQFFFCRKKLSNNWVLTILFSPPDQRPGSPAKTENWAGRGGLDQPPNWSLGSSDTMFVSKISIEHCDGRWWSVKKSFWARPLFHSDQESGEMRTSKTPVVYCIECSDHGTRFIHLGIGPDTSSSVWEWQGVTDEKETRECVVE